MTEKTNSKPVMLGLALAGGGPEGAIYEIGAIRALEEAIDGLCLNDVDVFVGVSAGSFIAANLANGISTADMCRSLVNKGTGEHPFNPEVFFTPAFAEYFRSAKNIPRFVFDAFSDYLGNREDRSVFKSLTKLARALPAGLFNNKPIRRFLERLFEGEGRTDDFRRLSKKLFVVAADLDSGEAVIFGKEGRDRVPISLAVQASCALPGLYPPVLIEDRYYVDGVLLKTLHTSTVLETGVDLTFCINPIVPVDTGNAIREGFMRRGRLIERGMPTVLAQTFRTMIHSRLTIGIASYQKRYASDVLLFEPGKDDYRMFFTNIFRFSSRKFVCEHAYRATLKDLSQRRAQLAPVLAKHGLRLRTEVLDAPDHDLWKGLAKPEERTAFNPADKLDWALSQLETALFRANSHR